MLMIPSSSYGNWTKLYTPLKEDSEWQNAFDISFCDSLNGIIATNYMGAFPKFVQPYFLITSNGGKSWTSITSDSIITTFDSTNGKIDTLFEPFEDVKVQYLDTNSVFGLIIEDYLYIPVTKSTAIVHSSDKGKNWHYTILDRDTNNIGVALKMLDKKTGMVATRRYVYLTNDSGTTWNKIVIPGFDSINEYIIWDAAYLDSKDIILLVIHHEDMVNYIFKSNDNGKSWKKFTMNDSANINGETFFFLDSINGWRCTNSNLKEGGKYHYTDRIYHTTNEGETWDLIYENTTSHVAGMDYLTFPLRIKFYDRKNGIAYNTKHVALITTDGGINWIPQFPSFEELPKGDTIYQFYSACYAGSKDNIFLLDYSYSALLHYQPSPNYINEEFYNFGSDLFLSPNPATDFLEISGLNQRFKSLVQETAYNIEIFSVYGEKVLSVGAKGPSPLQIDVASLVPGVYFVKVGDKILKFLKM